MRYNDFVKNLKDKIYSLMIQNRRTHGQFQYTVPSPDSYPFQWLWDSCFHAIIYSYFDIEAGKRELTALVSKQFDDGMIPHMIYWEKGEPADFPKIQWGKEDTSTITQPPMLAYAVWRIYLEDADKMFLESIYPHLKKFYLYLINKRDPRQHHLIGIINPDESGEDNSPRFDICLSLDPLHSMDENFQKRLDLVSQNKNCNFEIKTCMRNFFWIKDVPFNSIMVENLDCMVEIAKVLGQTEDENFFTENAKLISDAMRRWMLEDGIFWSVYGLDYKKIKVKSWAAFAPLFARICTKKEAEKLVNEYLLNDGFNTNYLVPTVDKLEPSFDPQGFWRGPIWIAINWFIYKGLKNYGFDEEAKKILDSSLALLEKSGFREQFNPTTGEGMGAKDFTWGGLVLDMT